MGGSGVGFAGGGWLLVPDPWSLGGGGMVAAGGGATRNFSNPMTLMTMSVAIMMTSANVLNPRGIFAFY